VGNLESRLQRLEEQTEKANSQWEVPMYTRIYLKHIERHRARKEGHEPPPFTQEEIEYLYQEDLQEAAGEGTTAHYRASPGWQTEEAEALLDAWQKSAARRVELVEELGEEEWRDVYNKDLGSLDEAQEGLSIFDLPENEQDERINE
jgi:hypothetical protein